MKKVQIMPLYDKSNNTDEGRAAAKRSLMAHILGVFIIGVVLYFLIPYIKETEPNGLKLYSLSLIPGMPIFVIIYMRIKTFEAHDELTRKIQIDAALLTFKIVAPIVLSYAVVEIIIPDLIRIYIIYVWLSLMIFYGLCVGYIAKKHNAL